jgi:restriction system protein
VTFWDAIATVLADEGGPLHSAVITERLLEQGLWKSEGKTPAATVAARLYTDIKKKGLTPHGS